MSSGDGTPGDGKHGASPSATHFKLLPEENKDVTSVTLLPLRARSCHTLFLPVRFPSLRASHATGPIRDSLPAPSLFSWPRTLGNCAPNFRGASSESGKENNRHVIGNYNSNLGSPSVADSLRNILVAWDPSSFFSIFAVATNS